MNAFKRINLFLLILFTSLVSGDSDLAVLDTLSLKQEVLTKLDLPSKDNTIQVNNDDNKQTTELSKENKTVNEAKISRRNSNRVLNYLSSLSTTKKALGIGGGMFVLVATIGSLIWFLGKETEGGANLPAPDVKDPIKELIKKLIKDHELSMEQFYTKEKEERYKIKKEMKTSKFLLDKENFAEIMKKDETIESCLQEVIDKSESWDEVLEKIQQAHQDTKNHYEQQKGDLANINPILSTEKLIEALKEIKENTKFNKESAWTKNLLAYLNIINTPEFVQATDNEIFLLTKKAGYFARRAYEDENTPEEVKKVLRNFFGTYQAYQHGKKITCLVIGWKAYRTKRVPNYDTDEELSRQLP